MTRWGRFRWALLAAAGCARDPGAVTAACAVDPDNALRVVCTVRQPGPGRAEVRFEADGEPARTFRSEVAGTEVAVVAWGLPPDTDWRWAAGSAEGQVRTGSLPGDLAGAAISAEGEAFGFDAVLQSLRCAGEWLVMIDPAGRIVWYEPTEVYQSPQDAYGWDPVRRVVWAATANRLVGVAVSGERVLDLRGAAFAGDLHHDLHARDGTVHVLFHEPVDGWLADGVHVVEGGAVVDSYRLADLYDPPSEPVNNGDWTHANSVSVSDAGEIVVSVRNQDTVIALDPGGQVAWTASAGDDSLGPHDFVAPPGEGWDGQHDASVAGDRLWLVDNLYDGTASRVARYRLADGEARLDAAWVLPERCPIQSGARPIDGGVLASCAMSGTSWAWREGEEAPAWTLRTACDGDPSILVAMNKAIPVRFD